MANKFPNKRLCASVLDYMIISPGILLLFMPFSLLQIKIPEFISSLVIFGLLVSRDTFNGVSPGKFIIGLKVVRLDGEPVTFTTSFQRNIILFFDLLLSALITISGAGLILGMLIGTLIGSLHLLISAVEYILIAFTQSGRRLGDYLAKTEVIDLHPERADWLYFVLSLVALIGLFILLKVLSPELVTAPVTPQ